MARRQMAARGLRLRRAAPETAGDGRGRWDDVTDKRGGGLPEMKLEIRGKPLMRTPAKVTCEIKELCFKIKPTNAPLYVDVAPSPGAKPLECFFNVQEVVWKDGGELLSGWAIWEWPRVSIEAEHHAVWKKVDGRLVDLTPNAAGTRQILFLPDEEAHFDFKGLVHRDNVRQPLTSLEAVRRLIEAAKQRHELIEACSQGARLVLGSNASKMKSIETSIEEASCAILEWLATSTGRDE